MNETSDTATHLHVQIAATAREIELSQQLRYRVFGEEMGARLHGADASIDSDHYDRFCHHLVVRDTRSGEVVGCTRILTDTQARRAGGFYSASEFDLGNIPALPGRIMEVVRTGVHPDYRGGSTIGVLWSGLAGFIAINRIDYLIGCASIGMTDGGAQARAIMSRMRRKHLSADHLRVVPRRPLPTGPEPLQPLAMPPLLKAYLRLGADVCGEPCWDPEFNVADVFVLVDVDSIQPRYARHFFHRPQQVDGYLPAAAAG
jgi:putative hemolysin